MNLVVPPTTFKLPPASKNGHWDFPEDMYSAKHAGFVYAVYDKVLGCGYIGKKHFHSVTQARKVESDWKSYMTSSNTLKSHFDVRPKEEFEFICLELYSNRGDLCYAESWSIITAKALESNAWYNRGVESVGWKVKVPPTARHKARLSAIIERVNSI